jgi:hypothetical protein
VNTYFDFSGKPITYDQHRRLWEKQDNRSPLNIYGRNHFGVFWASMFWWGVKDPGTNPVHAYVGSDRFRGEHICTSLDEGWDWVQWGLSKVIPEDVPEGWQYMATKRGDWWGIEKPEPIISKNPPLLSEATFAGLNRAVQNFTASIQNVTITIDGVATTGLLTVSNSNLTWDASAS